MILTAAAAIGNIVYRFVHLPLSKRWPQTRVRVGFGTHVELEPQNSRYQMFREGSMQYYYVYYDAQTWLFIILSTSTLPFISWPPCVAFLLMCIPLNIYTPRIHTYHHPKYYQNQNKWISLLLCWLIVPSPTSICNKHPPNPFDCIVTLFCS